jgi:hypothetical protein
VSIVYNVVNIAVYYIVKHLMYLLPLTIKARTCPYKKDNYSHEPLPKIKSYLNLNIKVTTIVDMRGVDKIFKFIATTPLCSTLFLYGTDKEIHAE